MRAGGIIRLAKGNVKVKRINNEIVRYPNRVSPRPPEHWAPNIIGTVQQVFVEAIYSESGKIMGMPTAPEVRKLAADEAHRQGMSEVLKNELSCGCHVDPQFGAVVVAGCHVHD